MPRSRQQPFACALATCLSALALPAAGRAGAVDRGVPSPPPAARTASSRPPLQSLPSLRPLTASDSVLVVAPHPDDETLCCAGILQRARAVGAKVAVVWLTSGDGFELDVMVAERTLRLRGKAAARLGDKRMAEAHAAAALLGVPAEAQFALGYPDRGLKRLLGVNLHQPLRSVYTRQSRVQGADKLDPGADYTGDNLRSDLATIIDRVAPTLVLAAAPQDRHADHSSSGRLVASLLQQRGQSDRLRYWLVHGGREWPKPRHFHPLVELEPAPVARALAWQSLRLNAAETAQKRSALLQHRSQMEVMAPFLLAFVRANELFALSQ